MGSSTLDLARLDTLIQPISLSDTRLYEALKQVRQSLLLLDQKLVVGSTPTSAGSVNLAGFTQGSILYVDPAETLAEDNTHLYFNPTTKQVGIGTGSPVSTAQLQIDSTSRGFLAPRMTTTQRDAIDTPIEGLLIYNTTLHEYQERTNTAWVTLTGGGGGGGWTDDGAVVRLTTATDRVSIGDNNGNAAAILALTSTTKGLLLPRLTATELMAVTTVAGLIVYNTSSGKLTYCDGSLWHDFPVGSIEFTGWMFDTSNFDSRVSLYDASSSVQVGVASTRGNDQIPRMVVKNQGIGPQFAIRCLGTTSTGFDFSVNEFGDAFGSISADVSKIVATIVGGVPLSVNQAGVGIGTTSPNGSAILDLTSTSKGMLVPRLTQPQINGMSGVAGMVVFNTTNGKLQYYSGSMWVSLTDPVLSTGWTYLDEMGFEVMYLTSPSTRLALGTSAMANNDPRLVSINAPGNSFAYRAKERIANESTGFDFVTNTNASLGALSAGATTIGLMNAARSVAGSILISQSNNNVGIGMAPTSIKLEVNGSIRANGPLQATQQAGLPDQAVLGARNLNAGGGLTGGGSLTADRTFSLNTSWSNTWTNLQTFNADIQVQSNVNMYSGGVRQGVLAAASGIIGLSNNTASGYIWIKSDGTIVFTGLNISYGAADSGGAGFRAVRVPN